MKIFNTQVYGLEQSLTRSGYPMQTDVKVMPDIPAFLYEDISGLSRGKKLGNTKPGSGHDCFLKGIVVQADIEAPSYWWPQWQRYHFADIISSQSKMHKAYKFDIRKKCCEYVDDDTINLAIWKLQCFVSSDQTKEDFERLIANLPQGLELTAGITTNYLQLKTMYNQRHNHRLKMWNTVFKEWVEGLPMFKELCLGGVAVE